MTERWLPVVGWEGLYEVSDLGRVRTLGRTKRWFAFGAREVERTWPAKIMSPSVVMGYLQLKLLDKPRRREQRKVHQLVLEAFIGPCPAGMEARHLDGVRTHCALSNLCWGTKLENAADKRLHGTQCMGETHGRAKLTESLVRQIRSEYAAGRVRQKDLAARYGIVQSKISALIRGQTWGHVQ